MRDEFVVCGQVVRSMISSFLMFKGRQWAMGEGVNQSNDQCPMTNGKGGQEAIGNRQ